MKVNKNSNAYIIIYSTVMVVVVALVLAWASLSLQPRQKANEENEMKGAILLSIGQGGDAAAADDKTAYVNAEYSKYIVSDYAVDYRGEVAADVKAFDLLKNLKAEYDKPAQERLLPVFVSRDDDGKTRYVLPLWGTGLWGPLWGYLALEGDWTTVYGVVFDHKSETPGLGAEIATPLFSDQFKGKQIFRDGRFVSISVLKGAGASRENPNAVDAITGGTITSRGVEQMLRACLSDYLPYIERQRAAGVDAGTPNAGVESIETEAEPVSENDKNSNSDE